MKKRDVASAVILLMMLLLMVARVNAGSYAVSKLSNVYTDANGRIAIKWENSSPNECGTPNYGWVVIEASADNTLKSFVYMLYTTAAPATITTSGCSGNNEVVTGIYTPGG